MENWARSQPRATTGRPVSQRPGPAPPARPPQSPFRAHLKRLSPAVRILGRALMILTPVVLLTLIAGVIGYVRLMHGPVSLKFLSGPIERGISAGFGGLEAKVDDTILRLADTGGFEFRIVNLRITEPGGAAVASAPIAAVELDATTLTSLQFIPRRIELIEPRMSISYSDAAGLSLSFTDDPARAEELTAPAPPASDVPPAAQPPAPAAEKPATAPAAFPTMLKPIDLARALAEYTARARRGTDATSRISEVGLKDATVELDYAGKTTAWKVPQLSIDLAHHSRRSVISGDARIESDQGPWSLTFRTEDSDRTNLLTLKASVRDLIPSSLGRDVPGLEFLRTVDLPMAGDASFELTTTGELNSAGVTLEFGRGLVGLGETLETPLLLDAGLLTITYDAAAAMFKIAPSTFKVGESRVTIAGEVTSGGADGAPPAWNFALRSIDGVLAAEEFKLTGIPLDAFQMTGRIKTEERKVEIDSIDAKAGGATLRLAGDIISAGGSVAESGVRLAGDMSPASADVLKLFWPRVTGPRARQYLGEHVTAGTLTKGTLLYQTGVFAGPDAIAAPGRPREYTSIEFDAADVEMVPFPGALPLRFPQFSGRVLNNTVTMTSPAATVVVADGTGLPLTGARFTASDIDALAPMGDVSFGLKGSLDATLQSLSRIEMAGLKSLALPVGVLDGRIDGQFKIKVPMGGDISGADVAIIGKARITDVKSREKIGVINVQSGAIDLDLNETQAAAKGELILNGVLAKLDWQRIMAADPASQPPLRLRAMLDNSDRKQLGMDVNQYVEGDVPVEITFDGTGDGTGASATAARVRADLTNADFRIDELAWRKPPGRPATVEFDIASGRTHKTELQNFKVTGEKIAIEGWIGLSADSKPQEFYFPDFSLNVVSRLELQGKRSAKNVWSVRAKGSTFDGKDFFRSLFSFDGSPARTASKSSSTLDLTADIDNVLGHSGVALRQFRLKMTQTGDTLTSLDARGTLDGGAPVAAVLDQRGSRKILAESTDAGQALKLVGFYPNMQRGRVRLEVDLDGRGAAEKTGILWIENFRILGDPVVAEVFSGAETSSGDPAIGTRLPGERRVVREVFEFDRMKLPFSVGYGQFVIEEAYLKGPVLGATLRGKVDYGAQRVNVGGTYIPLQGLNNVLGEIPVLGQILSGPRGEGIFGITFAVQGPMAQPQVIVNPLSLVAPGIFREIFQMTNPNPNVLPRGPTTPASPPEQRARASSYGGGDDTRTRANETVDGWSSDTVVPTKKKN